MVLRRHFTMSFVKGHDNVLNYLKKNQVGNNLPRDVACSEALSSYPDLRATSDLWFTGKPSLQLNHCNKLTVCLPLDWDPEDRTLGEEKCRGDVAWSGRRRA